jgi:hypothetical protein
MSRVVGESGSAGAEQPMQLPIVVLHTINSHDIVEGEEKHNSRTIYSINLQNFNSIYFGYNRPEG